MGIYSLCSVLAYKVWQRAAKFAVIDNHEEGKVFTELATLHEDGISGQQDTCIYWSGLQVNLLVNQI